MFKGYMASARRLYFEQRVSLEHNVIVRTQSLRFYHKTCPDFGHLAQTGAVYQGAPEVAGGH